MNKLLYMYYLRHNKRISCFVCCGILCIYTLRILRNRARKCSFAENAECRKRMTVKKVFLNGKKAGSHSFCMVICYNKTKIINWIDRKSEMLFWRMYWFNIYNWWENGGKRNINSPNYNNEMQKKRGQEKRIYRKNKKSISKINKKREKFLCITEKACACTKIYRAGTWFCAK